MAIRKCPHCNMDYVVSDHTGDYVHTCNSRKDVMDKEDVLIVGNWVDDNGSSGTVPPQQVLMQGAENKLFGIQAGRRGEDLNEHTRLGNTASTHRQRQTYTYIEEEKKDECNEY